MEWRPSLKRFLDRQTFSLAVFVYLLLFLQRAITICPNIPCVQVFHSAKPVSDFHRQVISHAERTTVKRLPLQSARNSRFFMIFYWFLSVYLFTLTIPIACSCILPPRHVPYQPPCPRRLPRCKHGIPPRYLLPPRYCSR